MVKELAKLIGGLLTTLLFGAAVLAGFVYVVAQVIKFVFF